jgi:thiamine transport system ATP-binding protein
MLECRQVAYRFANSPGEIRAAFNVDAGETVALMGPSGAGKTTVLNLIAGFLRPTQGDILWQGKSLLDLAPARRPLTYLLQSQNLFPHLSVQENIALGINPRLRISPKEAERIEVALERVGLSAMGSRLPTSLSGGQQQRVALARCLVRRHPVLLLDEPFTGLDRERRSSMSELLCQLQSELDLHLVIATHQLDEVGALDARIVSIDAGPV